MEQITTSVFPIAIGTSLALESLFEWERDNRWQPPYDPDREIPERISLSDYDQHWLDVKTLLRNLINALPTGTRIDRVDTGQLLDRYLMELERIQDIYKWYNVEKKLVFFYASFNMVKKRLPERLRIPSTDKQKYLDSLYLSILSQVLGLSHYTIKTIDSKIDTDKKLLVTSHQPYLYLSYKHNKKLDVLESHTGRKITCSQFNKYYLPIGKRKPDQLPYQERLYYLFGDKLMFKPYPIAIRKELMEIGTKYWTPMSTSRRVREDIGVYGSKALKDSYFSLPEIIR